MRMSPLAVFVYAVIATLAVLFTLWLVDACRATGAML